MRIELEFSELKRAARNKLAEAVVVAAIETEFNKIALRHKEAMLTELNALVSKFVIQSQRDPSIDLVKIIIHTNDPAPNTNS